MQRLTCRIDGCQRPKARRSSLCSMHLTRKRRHGDPSINLRDHPDTCTVPGCDEPYEALGYCNRHYLRARDGRPLDDPTPAARFWAKVVADPAGCWLWTAAANTEGYGVFQTEGHRTRLAHRWAYEHMIGDIPPGLELDHLCSVRRCVRPDHLDPVPGAINTARAHERQAAS